MTEQKRGDEANEAEALMFEGEVGGYTAADVEPALELGEKKRLVLFRRQSIVHLLRSTSKGISKLLFFGKRRIADWRYC